MEMIEWTVWQVVAALSVALGAGLVVGSIFGYWLSCRLRSWAVTGLYRDLYERDCEIAALKIRLQMLQPEADPRTLQEIRN